MLKTDYQRIVKFKILWLMALPGCEENDWSIEYDKHIDTIEIDEDCERQELINVLVERGHLKVGMPRVSIVDLNGDGCYQVYDTENFEPLFHLSIV